MTEVFKTRVEPTVTPETVPQAPLEVKTDNLAGNESKTQDEALSEEKTLDIWEGLNRRKYGEDYFDIRNIAHEFPLKAQLGFIDKWIKSEIESKGYEKNIENYQKIISEIETELGTSPFDPYKRLQKIFSYLQVVKKISELNSRKEKYKNSTII